MAKKSMSLREWEHSAPHLTDSVSVRNLYATVNAGVDVWGRRRAQPALISITAGLSQAFDSAAMTDSVDQSTIHYGKLSKAVLAQLEKEQDTWSETFALATKIFLITFTMARIQLCDVDIYYPKGSMLGEGVHVSLKNHTDVDKTAWVLHTKNVRVAAVIGVNSNEREMKQSVVANVWIDACNTEAGDSYPQVEQILVKVGYDAAT